MKLYFNDREFQQAGFSAPMINTLRKLAEFVDAQNAIEAAQADIDANADDITALAANDVALDARLDTAEADIAALEAYNVPPVNLQSYKVTARTVTATPTFAANDCLINVNATGGAVTVNLPALSAGRVFRFKKLDVSANTVTIDGNGSETIDGAATYVLTTQYESVEIIGGASEWHVV